MLNEAEPKRNRQKEIEEKIRTHISKRMEYCWMLLFSLVSWLYAYVRAAYHSPSFHLSASFIFFFFSCVCVSSFKWSTEKKRMKIHRFTSRQANHFSARLTHTHTYTFTSRINPLVVVHFKRSHCTGIVFSLQLKATAMATATTSTTPEIENNNHG